MNLPRYRREGVSRGQFGTKKIGFGPLYVGTYLYKTFVKMQANVLQYIIDRCELQMNDCSNELQRSHENETRHAKCQE